MTKYMSVISELEKLLAVSVKKAFPKVKMPDFKVEASKRPEISDYASNLHYLLAKATKLDPQKAAEKIIKAFSQNTERSKSDAKRRIKIARLTSEGPFLNIKLSDNYLQDDLASVLDKKDIYFDSKELKNNKINVEFISANPTGPLTLANARGGFSGDALSRVLAAAGAEVFREYYINDVGRQVEILAESVAIRYLEIIEQNAKRSKRDAERPKPVEFPEYCYQGEYIKDLAKEVLEEHGDEYKDMAILEIASHLEQYAYEKMLASIKDSVNRLGIKFDNWFSEKTLYETGQVEEVLAQLSKDGLIYEGEGASWFKSTLFGDDKDRVVKKSDGSFTYFASDIAYLVNKLAVRNFDQALILIGADHAGYVPRLKALLEPLKIKKTLTPLVFQLVRLFSKGVEVKISKRKGTFVTIDELLDEIPVDVARYFFLTKAFETHLDFNLDLAKEQSQKNPVYYIQYATARISQLEKKAKEAGLDINGADFKLLNSQEEKNLILEILRLSDLVESVAKSYALQALPEYAFSLANAFHIFYDTKRIIGEDLKIATARLALVAAAKIALEKVLRLMGISSPERM